MTATNVSKFLRFQVQSHRSLHGFPILLSLTNILVQCLYIQEETVEVSQLCVVDSGMKLGIYPLS